jgi:alpha-glucosidase (family GH31 glycosyl hydrolase)
MRALGFAHPGDERAWAASSQYLLGDELLVAPVTEPGVETWPVYLPAGEWVDAWTGAPHAGAMTLNRPVPLDEIPVYVRAGATGELLPVFRGDERDG